MSTMVVPMLELGAVPSLGDLLGSQSSTALTSYINSIEDRSQFFGSSFDTLQSFRQQFIDQLVTPVKQAGLQVVEFISQLTDNTPSLKAPETLEDLATIPANLYLPILTYGPVYKLHKQGRIDGYGLDPHYVKQVKPVYDRLIHENGYIDLTGPSKFGTKFAYYEFTSIDPEMTEEQLDVIWDTLDLVDQVLEETDRDPTDPESLRG